MKQLSERGDVVRYHGQIGRSQTHYTVDDYPLMRRVFAEDLWPILQEIAFVLHTVVILALFVSVSACVARVHVSHSRTRMLFAEEKLRQRGIRAGAGPGLQQPLQAQPAQARQPRIDEFFPRAVQD